MKKKSAVTFAAFFYCLIALAQQPSIVTNRTDTVALYKETIFNTARFLRFQENSLKFNGDGYGIDVPGLTYTFTLSKNTLIQISETVRFTTTACAFCPGGSQEAWFKNSIVIDREKFATFDYMGNNIKSGTSGGTVLAQLGPGTHTIKVHVGVNENSGDAFIYGYDREMGNRTFMSLLFFSE
jgi:hypothetical protein